MREIDKIYKKTNEILFAVQKITEDNDICEKVGQIAMDYIADYPLYASTSNISYEQAIALAFIASGGEQIEEAYVKAKFEKCARA